MSLIGRLTLCSLLVAPSVLAGNSTDEPPAEIPRDPGDVFFSGGALEVDDACPAIPGPPCLGVPMDPNFDLDAYSLRLPAFVCPPFPGFDPGILFSFDDGDPAAHAGPPDNAIELFIYDRCGMFGSGSFLTNVSETSLTLGANPPPLPADDDVDAFESRPSTPEWNAGGDLLFSPDFPATGGLATDPACPGTSAESHIYVNNLGAPGAAVLASPCTLGIVSGEDCDIDALAAIDGDPVFPGPQFLFSTDADHPCGLDPGDIYISDNAGNMALYADDVQDLRIAWTEDDPVDIDALSVNFDDGIQHLTPYAPPQIFRWKADWPDYAPSGVPDFAQDHGAFPGMGATFCGPTAVADSLWWFDSEMEGRCGGTPGDGVDDFPLVEAFPGVSDDHEPLNVDPFIRDLSQWIKTDQFGPGTRIADMHQGLLNYIDFHGKGPLFTVKKVSSPTYEQIACSVESSWDVILLLGFWWTVDGINYSRCGGHFVTSAGSLIDRDPGPDNCPGFCGIDDDGDGTIDEFDEMCACNGDQMVNFGSDDICNTAAGMIGVSDPGLNHAEIGGPGRIRGPNHTSHAPVAAPPPSHDDAANVSHDIYDIVPAGPGIPFPQELVAYGGGPDCATIQRWCEQNPDEEGSTMTPCPPEAMVQVAIEGMVVVSPNVTPVCLNIQGGLNQMVLSKGACPAPAFNPFSWDYIAGELCQLSESIFAVDLGSVTCLTHNSPSDQVLDRKSWNATSGIGAWFYLVRQDPAVNYGTSTLFNPRVPSAGDCP